MWSLMFIENLLHAQSHICLPNKHIFSFYNRRNRLRKVKCPVQILKSGFIPSFTWFCFTVLSASFIGSKKKIGFWFHTWVISSRGIDKISLLHTFADFLDQERPGSTKGVGTFVPLTQQSYLLPSTYNLNLSYFADFLITFYCKRK